jgi:alanyl-tRNA synthetase
MVSGGKVSLIAGVSKDIMDKIRAGDVVNFVAMQVGGKGGGKPDLAQAGGNNPAQLEVALNGVIDWVTRQITTAN